MDPLVLRILAAACFGLAAALLVLTASRLVHAEASAPHLFGGDSMRRAEMRRRAMRNSPLWAMFLPLVAGLARLVGRISPEPLRAYVRQPYARAGYPGGLDDDELVALSLLLGAAFMVLIGFSATVLVGHWLTWTGLLGLPLGFLAVVSHLKTRAAVREQEILRALPYVVDLVVLILRSGTAVGIALAKVVEDYREHPLGDELGQVLAEINMGSPRATAFREMARRLKINDVTALADSVVQSEELGWPLADTLERLSDRLSTERMLKAQATAGAAGVYVMLPSTLVLLSSVLLLFGPVIVRLLRGEFRLR